MTSDHVCLMTSIHNLAAMIPIDGDELNKLDEMLKIFIETAEASDHSAR